jgi:hypothetical protein
LPCHLASRDHDHVTGTSRVDHYRAPCGNRQTTPLVPTLVGWDDRCVLLSYKRETLPRCHHCQVSLFSSSTLPPLLFSSLANFLANPPLAHLRCCFAHSSSKLFAVFVYDFQKKLEEDQEKNPSSIVDHGSIHGDVRVPPLDACSDVPLHRRRSLPSFSFPCTHPSPSPS